MGIDKDDMQELMYRTLLHLTKSKYTIVFKGSLLLSTLMEQVNIVTPSRLSRDVDGDLQDFASLDEILSEITTVLHAEGYSYAALKIDPRTTNEQYHIGIYDTDDQFMFGVDLGIKLNPWHTTYKLSDGTVFFGQTIAKIFWDKACVVSSNEVEVRSWDLFDMYLLSLRNDLRMSEILTVKEGTQRPLGDWSILKYPTEALKSSWRKRRYIRNRPVFEDMCARVRDLCTPFMIQGSAAFAMWDPNEGLWYDGETSF